MKYFGKKSLSSFLVGFLNVFWYIVLVAAIIAPFVISAIVFFSTPIGDSFIMAAAKFDSGICGKTFQESTANQESNTKGLTGDRKEGWEKRLEDWDKKSENFEKKSKNWEISQSEKDKRDWENFKNLPLGVKILMIPYAEAVLILLLIIIKASKKLFFNFKNDIIFNRNNVLLISRIGKLNIAFSIMTCNISSLILSIMMFMLCDLIKNGVVLQEEHDLTV